MALLDPGFGGARQTARGGKTVVHEPTQEAKRRRLERGLQEATTSERRGELERAIQELGPKDSSAGEGAKKKRERRRAPGEKGRYSRRQSSDDVEEETNDGPELACE